MKSILLVLAASLMTACSTAEEAALASLFDEQPKACALPLPRIDALFPAKEIPCSQRKPRADGKLHAMSDSGIGLASTLGLPKGRYALPGTEQPTQLVVMFHGHQNNSCSWRNHLRAAAAKGAVAVAMDYSDQEDRNTQHWGLVENWGWAVRSGAKDSILAAQYFLNRYPTIKEVFLFGASMGGNVSGYAGYFSGNVRADCSKMWDYWVAAEGVHNLTQEYEGVRRVAVGWDTTGNSTQQSARQAQLEIEEENGGTLEQVPARYTEITNTANVAGLSYLKGVVLTHGTNDATVPFNQSEELFTALQSQGVPVHFHTITNAGHQWEGDGNLTVMRVALEELFRLMAGGGVTTGKTPHQN